MAERDEELPSSDDLVRQAREKFEEVPPQDDLATTPYDEAALESGSQEADPSVDWDQFTTDLEQSDPHLAGITGQRTQHFLSFSPRKTSNLSTPGHALRVPDQHARSSTTVPRELPGWAQRRRMGNVDEPHRNEKTFNDRHPWWRPW